MKSPLEDINIHNHNIYRLVQELPVTISRLNSMEKLIITIREVEEEIKSEEEQSCTG